MSARLCATGRLVALLALLAVGCRPLLAPRVPPGGLLRADAVPALGGEEEPAALADAVQASLAYYARLAPGSALRFGSETVPVVAMQRALESLLALLATAPPPEVLGAEVGRRFVAYRATVPAGVLFTGYYVPTLAARPVADAQFRFPLLGRPPDLVTAALADFAADCPETPQIVGRVSGERLVPYFTRAEIAAGAVAGAPVLAWVDDPVALFFLQIQGSGRLLMPDGSRRTIGFAASNGRPYVSVGRLLTEEGRLAQSEASMQGIRRWAAAHPEESDRVLNANPRYVFFREIDGPPIGSLGVPVTADRTIATDPAYYPPGALALIRIAGGRGVAGAQLVLNQDAGAAIRGPGRVDLFLGEGEEAETIAGRLKARGELFFLAPRDALPRIELAQRRRG